MASGTLGKSLVAEFKVVTVFAYPAGLFSRVADNQCIGRHRFGYYSRRTNKSIGPYFISTNNGSVGTDSSSLTNNGFPEFMLPVNSTAGINDIGKHHGRT